MSWTCPGHYKVHVHGRDSPGCPVHGHCPVLLLVLPLRIVIDCITLMHGIFISFPIGTIRQLRVMLLSSISTPKCKNP